MSLMGSMYLTNISYIKIQQFSKNLACFLIVLDQFKPILTGVAGLSPYKILYGPLLEANSEVLKYVSPF
ncbi:hypothetical protein FLM9_226 [Candidatus Synechococcus spongiarum]|uniref:Uncharacterized protein n=1 Tax=Candidatus Synechococcus spongiarum TaxID=431041 RepID=A0A171DEY3_9SYNE|nr:hypothetical protein FLM9_226 [Candidatus Synechococcus spongiarum]